MRIGLLYPAPNPISPTHWSGTPHGIAGGLRQAGVDLKPIAVTLPPHARVTRALAQRLGGRQGAAVDRSARIRSIRTATVRRSIDNAGPLDAILAMGTEMYDLEAALPAYLHSYTYDDGTLAQMWEHAASDVRASGHAPSNVSKWIEYQRKSCQQADGCFVATNWAASSVVNDYGIEPRKVNVVGIGHDPLQHAATDRDWNRPQFLFVGRDWERKNGPAVLKAFNRVLAVRPGARLHLVGAVPEIAEPGVINHGLLLRDDPAAQEHLRRLYAMATCFVLPSRFEPAGIAYLEAASAGLPVIATTEGGASGILNRGSIVVHPMDLSGLVRAMLLMTDPPLAATLGKLAAVEAERFSWAAVAERILSCMQTNQSRAREGKSCFDR